MKPTRKLLKACLQANRALLFLFLFLGLVGNTSTVMGQSGTATPHPTAELSGSSARNMAVGTLLVIPSAVYSDEFVSSLVVLNMDTEPNNVLIFATGSGESIGSLTITLGVGQRFRSTNILQQLGAPPGSSGVILLRSTNNRLLSALSEVSSSRGAAGFLPAVNVEAAWTQGFLLEAVDSGPPGMPGTYRTNLGLINASDFGNPTDVTMTLFNSFGQQVGNPLVISRLRSRADQHHRAATSCLYRSDGRIRENLFITSADHRLGQQDRKWNRGSQFPNRSRSGFFRPATDSPRCGDSTADSFLSLFRYLHIVIDRPQYG